MNSVPRLCWIAPYYLPRYYGGAVQVYHQLLRGLTGFEVTVISDSHNASSESVASFDSQAPALHGYRVRRLERLELQFAESAPIRDRLVDTVRFFTRTGSQFRRILDEERPDIVVCGATLAAGWLACRIPRQIALVNYVHGEELTIVGSSRFLRRYFKMRQMQAIRRAVSNIAVSRFTADALVSRAGADGGRVVVLPNAVDTAVFRPPDDRNELRRRFGWDDRFTFLTVARLVARKGVDHSLQALAQLQKERVLPENWLYVIGGQGEMRAQLESLARGLGLMEHVEFLGFVPAHDLASLYGAADLFLQPNREVRGDTEGFGIVFLEANACGTPVIGGIAGGTADAIEDGVSGLRVDGENVSEVAGAIRRLCQDRRLLVEMSGNAVDRIRRRFALEDAVLRLKRVLEDAIESSGREDRS